MVSEQNSPTDEMETNPAEQKAEAAEAQAGAESEAKEQAETEADPIAALKEQLETAVAEGVKLRDEALRIRAEAENQRKRSLRDVDQARKFALERFMKDLLEVSDSLDRGVEAATDESASVAQLKEGSELTQKMLGQVLSKHGLTEVNPEGEKFNPDQHEAMSMIPTEDHEPDTVVQVIQKGFVLNDRLLRPARVLVAKKP